MKAAIPIIWFVGALFWVGAGNLVVAAMYVCIGLMWLSINWTRS